ncbi:DUF1643 domain-containing protein [Nevskia sp.]|uniref:DUF1643 domain-containing protein n=1 Tax=Nevskia sp. TaxID=1929292 RepID=UPI0025E8D05C|nr:DUF1643 domain-containing protein [Nevskia sp.]
MRVNTFDVRNHTSLDGMKSVAAFSLCGAYRYWLARRWADGPMAVLLAMNPSTADERDNDPTIERFYRRVMQWNAAGANFGAVGVVNVFAIRETDSKKLPAMIKAGVDIVGPANDDMIFSRCLDAGIVLCGWGRPGNLLNRGRQVRDMLVKGGIALHALRINADGSPEHPLYVGYDVAPVRYEGWRLERR